jgi:2-oxoacid:acceptor oxidoreductase gamma subunit (pyruvate/2-ketoisovalerate family)
VVVVDPTLVDAIDVTEGLKEGGVVIINSDKKPDVFKIPKKFRVTTINATGIAVEHKLGTLAAPIVNTAIVGAVVKILNLTRLDSLLEAIKEGVPIKPEENVAAAKDAYDKAERAV